MEVLVDDPIVAPFLVGEALDPDRSSLHLLLVHVGHVAGVLRVLVLVEVQLRLLQLLSLANRSRSSLPAPPSVTG